MKRLLFILLLLCPMVAFGQRADSIVVEHSSDTLIVHYNTRGDETSPWHQYKYYTRFRPFIVGTDKDWSRGGGDKVLADTVINGYRVNILGGWPCDTLSRHHLYAIVRVLHIEFKMQWEEYYYQGQITHRHNEVLDRMRGSLNNFKARNIASNTWFYIGKGGIVRSYRMWLSKGLYDANKPSNYVKVIESLNADTPFIDWQKMNPEDTLPSVYQHCVLPRYIIDGDFVHPERSEK